jgi:NADPH-dependent 2,4-dienoyl-CoA reductase/sulfur reductase-like enzyme
MHIVVIGNGVAGNSAAKGALRNPDTRVTLIDGNTTPYYSACVLPDYVSGDIPRERVVLENSGQESTRLERCRGKRVSAIDPLKKEVLFTEGSSTPFDRLILATGSVSLIPPVQGANLPGNFTLKTLDDATRIRQRPLGSAVVIGSGLIGIEAAIALRKLGQSVTLIEAMDRIGPRILDPIMAERAQQTLEAQGIDVGLEELVVEVHGVDKVEAVKTDKRILKADIVVWATGMKPQTILAGDAGITLGANFGILVDASMQTSVQGIYAAGDVAEYPDPLFSEDRLNLFWYFGVGQGRVAGMNAAGLRSEFPSTLQMGTARLFDTPLAFVGYTEAELRGRGLSPETKDAGNGKRFFHQVFLDGRLVGIQMIHPNREEILWRNRVMKMTLDKPAKPWGFTIPFFNGGWPGNHDGRNA